MKLLQRIAFDLRRGENLDLYITVILAISISIISILGFSVSNLISPLTLAILGLLAFSALHTRHSIENIEKNLQVHNEVSFLQEFPESFHIELEKSRSVLIMGVSLGKTLTNPSTVLTLENKVKRGDTIRILLVDPEGIAVEAATLRSSWDSVENTKQRIKSSIVLANRLKQISPKNVEVRTVNYQLSYGAFLMNFNTRNLDGILYYKYYSFKSGHVPKMCFFEKRGEWFQFFKTEILLLWESGKAITDGS